MKKVYLLLLGMFCLMITGCKSKEVKEVKTTNDFESVAQNIGFTVEDNMESYLDVDYISESLKANYDDAVVEMIVYSDSDMAEKVVGNQIDNFKDLKSTGVSMHNDEGANYHKFWMVSNGYYMVTSRVDNTLIFTKTLLKNKEKIEKILEEMDY